MAVWVNKTNQSEKVEEQIGNMKVKGEIRPKFKKGQSYSILRADVESKHKTSFAERQLTNVAIVCALALLILTLQNVNVPLANDAANFVKAAISGDFKLDESLGKLKFVQNIVPEAILVFWNASNSTKLASPIQGEISHAYDEAQPWREYSSDLTDVRAAAKGKVKSVKAGTNGDWIVILSHDGGVDTVYAYLGKAVVNPGDEILAGTLIGQAMQNVDGKNVLYFEVRVNGRPTDPASLMGGDK